MGRQFTKRFSAVLVLVLLLETANASYLRWVAAMNGNIPPYAVAGGENFSGEALYVARFSVASGKHPGKMAPSYKKAHTGYGGHEVYSNRYEILTNPGWRSHLEWKKSSGRQVPKNAVVGGHEAGGTQLYVARFMYVDGHMIPGKANYNQYQKAYIGYNDKEFESSDWYVLVEHPAWYVRRGISKLSAFSELPGVKNHLKRSSLSK